MQSIIPNQSSSPSTSALLLARHRAPLPTAPASSNDSQRSNHSLITSSHLHPHTSQLAALSDVLHPSLFFLSFLHPAIHYSFFHASINHSFFYSFAQPSPHIHLSHALARPVIIHADILVFLYVCNHFSLSSAIAVLVSNADVSFANSINIRSYFYKYSFILL